ncbi:DNA ligase 1 [Salvelinus fontinalis]|uniref:DNA ligase 1 n=1 Tax=Salvelinus fontinalis TaxID=8038 RepID=UPI0024866721|nr:DNA ligase 1 [Salvelinus fontinalis]
MQRSISSFFQPKTGKEKESKESDGPVKEKPVKEKPVKEKPVKEKPVKEKPVKEKPVKEKPVKEKPVKEKPEPVKRPLKVQNGVHEEPDSPVKKFTKRSRQILDSDDDDEAPAGIEQEQEDMAVQPKDEVFKAVTTPLSPASPVTTSASPVTSSASPVTSSASPVTTSASPVTSSATPVTPSATPVTPSVTPVTPAASPTPGTPDTPTSISPSGIPKRRTARKQFPKRKLDSRSGSEKEEEEQGQQNKRAKVEETQDSTENEEEAMDVGGENSVEKPGVAQNNPEEKETDEEKEKALDVKETATEKAEEEKGKSEKAKERSPKGQKVKERSPKGQKVKERIPKGQKVKERSPKGQKAKERSPKERSPKGQKVKERSPKGQKAVKDEKEKVSPKNERKEEKDMKEEKVSESPQAKKAPTISSFFAPRKAAVKMERPEKSEGDGKEKSEGDGKEKSEGDGKEKSEGDGKEKSEGDGKEKSEGDGKEKSEGDGKEKSEECIKEEATVSRTPEDVKDKKGEKTAQAQYDPSRPNYHPVDHACWSWGQRVPYLAVARTFEKIEEDSGRLRNIETLSNLLRSVIVLSPEDLLCCVYLCLNQLGPAYMGLELGVGDTVLMKAVAQATGRQLDKIKAEAAEKGDLGLVAESSRNNQRIMFQPANLIAGGVFNKLKDIGNMSGNSAMNKKIDIIKGLFVACRFSEARYIVRSLAGKLRIGLAEQSVLSALSQAVCLTPPGQDFPPAVVDAGKGMSAEKQKAWIEEKSLVLKQTYCEMPNYDVIIPVILKEGIDELPNHCKLTPGVPLRPMLAHPTKGVGEVMKRFDEAAFTCEYKYDGERAQIHILENGEVRIFSRNQEDNTTKYPDIISRIPTVKNESVISCVLDSEAVAWDREKKQIQPFQVLTTRKRKDVAAADIKVQVCVYAFDLLYLNGESLVKKPLSCRRALLKESFQEKEGEFVFARAIDSDNTDVIAEFLEQSVRDSCEGLMVKTLEKDATYEIAKRSHNWLKLKKDYLDGVGDTMDLCVIGAYLGKGKRTGTYGGFLLACYDEDNEEFQSVCKIGTGFKDEDLEQHYKFLKEHILPKPRPYYRVDQSTEPDLWLDAVQVWEVKCADLSLSPIYKAGMGLCDPEKGISLRFPRFLRIRDDKKPEEATSGGQIADLYRKQQVVQNQGDKADLEDYY